MAAGRKSLHALGDIGNLITVRGDDGKEIPQVSRTVTRAFVQSYLPMHMIKRIRSNALVANIKGPIVVDLLLLEKRAAVRLPVLIIEKWAKRATEDIIKISPDSREVTDKNDVEKWAKKKTPTLTAALTARSEVLSDSCL
ncbi:hypothetical protein OROMI_019423 [Orobanche minor]